MFSTSGDIIMNVRGYHVYIRGCFSTSERYHEYIGGNIKSTLGDVQYIRGISDACGGEI